MLTRVSIPRATLGRQNGGIVGGGSFDGMDSPAFVRKLGATGLQGVGDQISSKGVRHERYNRGR